MGVFRKRNLVAALPLLILCIATTGFTSALAQKRSPARRTPSNPTSAVVTIITEPNAIVWIDEIRRGQTDATGRLQLQNVSGKSHTVRIRATGFRESTNSLLAGRRSLSVTLVRTTDQAELLFQQAERSEERRVGEECRSR